MNQSNASDSPSFYYSFMDSETSDLNDESTLQSEPQNLSIADIDSSRLEKTLKSKKSSLYEKSLARAAIMAISPQRAAKRTDPCTENDIRSSTPNELFAEEEIENDGSIPNTDVPKMEAYKEEIVPQIIVIRDSLDNTRVEEDEGNEIVSKNGNNWMDIKKTAMSPSRLLLQNLINDEKETLDSVLPPPLDSSILSFEEELPHGITDTPEIDFELMIPKSELKANNCNRALFDTSSGAEADTEISPAVAVNEETPETVFEKQALAKLPDTVAPSVIELDKKPAPKRVSMIPKKRETISAQYRSKKTNEPGEVRPPVRNWKTTEPEKPSSSQPSAANGGAIRKTTVNYRRTMLPTPAAPSVDSTVEKKKVTLKTRQSLHPASLRPVPSKPKTPVFKINRAQRRMSGIGISPAGRLSMGRSKNNGPRKSLARKTINPRATMYNLTGAAAKLAGIKSNPLPQSSGPKFTGTIPKISVTQAGTSNVPKKPAGAALRPSMSMPKYTGTIPKQSQPKKPVTTANDNKCMYCDKKFALAKALENHQLDKCDKIPPAAKKQLLAKQRAALKEAVASRSYRSQVSTESSSASIVSNADSSSMLPPRSKGLVKSNVKQGSLLRTPSKKLGCKPCNLKFKDILAYSNHNSEVHMPKSSCESSDFETETE